VALGEIGDGRATAALIQSLNRRFRGGGIFGLFGRSEPENEFVRRAAARSLGQIGQREAVPALIDVLADRRSPDDLRREAARALGLI
ncbi:HEAT repeat domain-containing protein, partial [Acinetobacter baumannii]